MTSYYYLDSQNNRIGPLSLEEIRALNLPPQTLVWRSGLTQWTPAADVSELAQPATADAAPQTPRQTAAPAGFQQPCPPTNLVWSILITLFCCLPFGLVAVYYSSRVERLYYNGDYAASLKASKRAEMWCIISLLCQVAATLIYAAAVGALFLGPLFFLF
mgnify:FL=1|jgi:hypothetical protein